MGRLRNRSLKTTHWHIAVERLKPIAERLKSGKFRRVKIRDGYLLNLAAKIRAANDAETLKLLKRFIVKANGYELEYPPQGK